MNRDNEAYLFFKVSCTKDEAVGMLLGWMQGFTRPTAIELNSRCTIPKDQLPLLRSLDAPLIDYITDLRNAAYEDFGVLYEKGSTVEELDAQAAVVDEYNKLAEEAWGYLIDITDEIAKGELSALRIDQEESNRSGHPHYTLKSIDTWTNKTYNKSIFCTQESTRNKDKENRFDAIGENEAAKRKVLSRTVASNLYVTFGFLTDLLAETSEAYKLNGKINITRIAERLEAFVKQNNKGEVIYGQSAEAIKSRIEDAMKHKQSALPGA